MDEGIRSIAEWDGVQDRIRGLFSLSQGFARLLKLTMTLILHAEGSRPSNFSVAGNSSHQIAWTPKTNGAGWYYIAAHTAYGPYAGTYVIAVYKLSDF